MSESNNMISLDDELIREEERCMEFLLVERKWNNIIGLLRSKKKKKYRFIRLDGNVDMEGKSCDLKRTKGLFVRNAAGKNVSPTRQTRPKFQLVYSLFMALRRIPITLSLQEVQTSG